MKIVTLSAAAILLSLPVISTLIPQSGHGLLRTAVANAAPQTASVESQTASLGGKQNPCAPPTRLTGLTGTLEETAWRLWVAATCPVNADQYPYVVWENWLEQDQMYPQDPQNGLKVPNALAPSGPAHLLHASPLALTKHPELTT
ncbi:MAG: hypothetical protein JOZ45_16695, partial [Acidobacteriaceae bacterium]|nr:hypothetical protein [Acidobacteriaceae bacterium]